jgi:CO/xanthine dehydrogenase FAD-binding subunit
VYHTASPRDQALKAAPFDYVRAASIGEACELLARHGDGAKLIAGGQSLVPMMAMRLVRPAWLVDINEIPALKFVNVEKDVARIGAGTRQCTVERDPALAARVPLLRQALAWVGHVQTRNRGTVGGSLAHADPSAELPLVAQVLGARMVLRSKKATRTIEAAQFFTGPMATAARFGECLEEIQWPVWPERRTGSAFMEISIRHGDFAMVAAVAQIALDGDGRCTRAALGLGGVGGTPLAFPKIAARLAGTKLDDAVVRDAAEAAAAACEPGSDLHASAEYRRHLAGVLAGRALREARDRARAA